MRNLPAAFINPYTVFEEGVCQIQLKVVWEAEELLNIILVFQREWFSILLILLAYDMKNRWFWNVVGIYLHLKDAVAKQYNFCGIGCKGREKLLSPVLQLLSKQVLVSWSWPFFFFALAISTWVAASRRLSSMIPFPDPILR